MKSSTESLVRRDEPQPWEHDGVAWGSDRIADLLRELDIPYLILNPGSSYRGLHDSLVNHLGNRQPQMIVVLHEEHAVAIAHGYAKVTGKPLGAALHAKLREEGKQLFDAWMLELSDDVQAAATALGHRVVMQQFMRDRKSVV